MNWQTEIIYILQIKAISLAVIMPVFIGGTMLWRLLRGTPFRRPDDRLQVLRLLGVLLLISVLSFPNDYGDRFGVHGVMKIVLTVGLGAIVLAIAYVLERWMQRRKKAAGPQPPSTTGGAP